MLTTSLRTLTRILFTGLIIAALASCTHTRRDGPPPFDVDVSHIPNAKPKPEKLAKYGNMPVYRIAGKRYYPMKSSRNFEEVGVASWYGTLFHERRTSSGEKYDMLGMTAAHRTLPLPTYVEVTNLKNHKQIIVKVNDRGPFASNRVIDLSYVAAKKLGMIGHGTALVRVRAINPYTFAEKPSHNIGRKISSTAPAVIASIYLQAGAFKNKANANKLRNRLANMISFPVRVSHPVVSGRLYRVQIGPIRDSASAAKITQRLKQIGISANKTRES